MIAIAQAGYAALNTAGIIDTRDSFITSGVVGSLAYGTDEYYDYDIIFLTSAPVLRHITDFREYSSVLKRAMLNAQKSTAVDRNVDVFIHHWRRLRPSADGRPVYHDLVTGRTLSDQFDLEAFFTPDQPGE